MKSSYADSGPLVAKDKTEFGTAVVGGHSKTGSSSGATTQRSSNEQHRRSRKDRVSPAVVTSSSSLSSASASSSRMENGSSPQYKINKPTSLTVETKDSNCSSDQDEYRAPRTPTTAGSSPTPTNGLRGNNDLRSPGVQQTPAAKLAKMPENGGAPIPDFITQTDASGNSITPRSAQAIEGARKVHPSGPKPHLHINKNGKLSEDDEEDDHSTSKDMMDEACTTVLDSIRFMCCCLLPPETTDRCISAKATQDSDDKSRVKLLGDLHPDDTGKKCLVLDLDETLVHSSFRAVPGADFVIPVQVGTLCVCVCVCVCVSSYAFRFRFGNTKYLFSYLCTHLFVYFFLL